MPSPAGFAQSTTQLEKGATAWNCSPLPQNRDLMMVTAGNGAMRLYKCASGWNKCICILWGFVRFRLCHLVAAS